MAVNIITLFVGAITKASFFDPVGHNVFRHGIQYFHNECNIYVIFCRFMLFLINVLLKEKQ